MGWAVATSVTGMITLIKLDDAQLVDQHGIFSTPRTLSWHSRVFLRAPERPSPICISASSAYTHTQRDTNAHKARAHTHKHTRSHTDTHCTHHRVHCWEK